MLVFIFISFFIFLFYQLVLYFWHLSNRVKEVPYVSFDPRILFKFGKWNMYEITQQISNSYDRLGKGFIGHMLTIFVDHPDDLRTILNSKDCLDKPYIYRLIPGGDGLLTANEHVWKFYRKHYKDGFSINALNAFVPIFNEVVKKLRNKLDERVGSTEFDIFEHLYAFNAETILRTTMNFHVQRDILDADADYYVNRMIKVVQRVLEISSQRFENFILHPDFIFRLTSKYREQKKLIDDSVDLIAQVQNECTSKFEAEKGQSNGSWNLDSSYKTLQNDFILKNIFQMHQEGIIDQKALQDHINTILVAGTDTSTLTMSAALMMLAIHKNVQERAFTEIIDVCGVDATHYDLTMLSKLHYIDCILKETMRLYPVAPMFGRITTADVKLETTTIPKNTIVVMFIGKTQQNPQFWGPNANRFDPDRFADENNADRHPYAFVPFSAGARNCVGYKYGMISMKIQLCSLLTRFKFTTDVQMDDILMDLEITLRMANGYKLRIERR